MADQKIFFAPFSIANDAFDLSSKASDARMKLRSEWNISPEAKVVLFVAKLTRQKRPMDLVAAFMRLKHDHPDAVLLFAGSGEEESSLREAIERSGINARIMGFINQVAIPAIYAASDIFVLPAEAESWGLVVNEAMAAGLPVVVSDSVGAAPDLVDGKDTGIVYPVGDIEKLVEAIDALLSSPVMIHRMGGNARKLIAGWSVNACADGIARAARSVLHAY